MSSLENRLDEVGGLVPTGVEAAILAVDKPAGLTSHDVVARIRRSTGMKAGHAGTLDPFATGLLLVLLGRATRLQRYLLGLSKRYEATARLGWISTTGDPDGELTDTGRFPPDLDLPTGEIDQMVPLTSAVRVDGERLYRKAHRGEISHDRPIRKVTVHSARVLEVEPEGPIPPEKVTYELEVSSGTYVRTLIETLDDAYCERLRRTAIGPIELNPGERVVPIREAMAFLPRVELDEEQKSEVSFGRSLPGASEVGSQGRSVCLTFGDSVIAIARQSPENTRPEVVLTPA